MAKFVVTGNEVTIFIAGQKIPLVQTLRVTDDYGHEPASGVGDIHVTEYTPTLARHSISISRFVMTKDSFMRAGFLLTNGDDAMKNATFDIEVFSKLGNSLMRKYTQCKNNSADIAITAHRVLVNDANFFAIDVTGQLYSPAQSTVIIGGQ